MHALRGTRRLLAGLALAAFTIGFVPGSAAAKPWPNAKADGFKLFAKSFSNFAANRVSLGLSTRGEVGVDSTGSGTVGGGYWPRGTADEYVFNSGLQIGGIIQGAKSASNPWGGDTTGAFFFDPKGTTRNGSEVTQIYNSNNPDDVANWPAAALVPQGDSSEVLFDPLLRGTVTASQGDEWWMTWEGDPAFISGRTHPLGVAAEYRIMGWNYPSGNEDLAYVIVTFYNITSTDPADYAQHRPAMRDLLLAQAAKFQSLNNAKFGITLPTKGYTIGPMYAAFAADMDVGTGTNFISVNLPFAMGFSYQSNFFTAPGWVFDPSIFGSPFFPGVGFIGTKYLKGPEGVGKIQLFSGNVNGGTGFPDPNGGLQLFRYLSAGLIQGIDRPCTGAYIPSRDHICYIQQVTGADTRHFQSSTALTVKPGAAASIVIAYIFAAPVALPGFTPTSGNVVDPGQPLYTNHPDSMLAHPGATGLPGVNRVDSITGFLAYIGQTTHNADNSEYEPTQKDFKVVPKSLLSKALIAQSVFDNHFLLPFAPDKPTFFLVPGDKQVTILWKPSHSDQADPTATGDAYFTVAGNATTNGSPNSLYDPNYRRFDVEGYRIYRGRTDAPNALKLLAQFDYAGTVFNDFGGNVQAGNCAPEIGTLLDCPKTFAVTTPGVTSTVFQSYDINGSLIQVKYGDRDKLANGKTITFHADTAITGENSGFPAPSNNGVPFIFVDKTGTAGCSNCGVFNNVKYYYSVTAFDVNSVNSAPSSLESPRSTKAVIVGAPAGNFDNTSTVQSGVFGRSGLLTDNVVPTVDAQGRFSKNFPPSNAVTVSLAGFATQLLRGSGSAGIQYDSTTITSAASIGSVGTVDWYTVLGGTTKLSIPISIPFSVNSVTETGNFAAITVDPALASIYGGGAGYGINGAFTSLKVGTYWLGNQGRGCVNGVYALSSTRAGQCFYTGPRWFSGANETAVNQATNNPVVQNSGLNTCVAPCSYNNGGQVTGAATVHWPNGAGYMANAPWRDVEMGMGPFITNADYKLYWGAAGKIDSVIDITHNEPVPFKPTVGNSWGVLNSSGTTAAGAPDGSLNITATDIGCVPPLRTFSVTNLGCTATFAFENTAKPGPVAFFVNAVANSATAAPAANAGFMLYIKGRIFIFELTGGAVPASGTVWTDRDYTGILFGGVGPNGDEGAYTYVPAATRPFNAPGAQAKFAYTVNNALVATTSDILGKVHTVPDPYYVTSAYDRTTTSKTIKFVNLPTDATVRIYTSSGILVKVLHNTTTQNAGTVDWDIRNRSNQFVASGVYFYTVESGGLTRTFRLTIVNYASNIQ